LAVDEDACAFCLRHGLEPSPTDTLHLMILPKDITAALEAARRRWTAAVLVAKRVHRWVAFFSAA
jgi:hypothetical protein